MHTYAILALWAGLDKTVICKDIKPVVMPPVKFTATAISSVDRSLVCFVSSAV